ncbi:acetyltransferase [Streptomyces phage Cursive]|uniref:Acetyltransferase n=1 Tax=Streptomyces phage Cross TaxID=2805844 RepID=A0A890UUZ3_9CAUD|nr:acetyltransferase [Streptomyces phage Cross]
MRTKTAIKLVRNLTPEEYRKCRSLNLRWGGYMQEELMFARRGERGDAKAVLITESGTDRLIAWSLLLPKDGQMIAHYYTRRSCRRQGFGDRLMKSVQKVAPKPIVVPGEDIMSQRFFGKHKENLTITNVYSLYES